MARRFPADSPDIGRKRQLKTDFVRTRLTIEEMRLKRLLFGRRKLMRHVAFGGLRTDGFFVFDSMLQIDCEMKSLSVTKSS